MLSAILYSLFLPGCLILSIKPKSSSCLKARLNSFSCNPVSASILPSGGQ